MHVTIQHLKASRAEYSGLPGQKETSSCLILSLLNLDLYKNIIHTYTHCTLSIS